MKSKYQIAKSTLLSISNDAKSRFRNDKPAVRQTINDTSYEISRDLFLSEYQTNLLSNYACKLHDKK